jgi:hypothetical protein
VKPHRRPYTTPRSSRVALHQPGEPHANRIAGVALEADPTKKRRPKAEAQAAPLVLDVIGANDESAIENMIDALAQMVVNIVTDRRQERDSAGVQAARPTQSKQKRPGLATPTVSHEPVCESPASMAVANRTRNSVVLPMQNAFYSPTVPSSNGSFFVPPPAPKQPQAPPRRDPDDSARHIADVLAETWVRILERRAPGRRRRLDA